mmetsp:Transcript_1428/g.2705  ORF Transcript_1428/g.2705 Transcript_1428/m.2705 type:complete len:98 (+) Transcript_1428:651-944(+)
MTGCQSFRFAIRVPTNSSAIPSSRVPLSIIKPQKKDVDCRNNAHNLHTIYSNVSTNIPSKLRGFLTYVNKRMEDYNDIEFSTVVNTCLFAFKRLHEV